MMMKQQIENDFGKKYIDWLKQNISQYKVNDNTYRITLPFLDKIMIMLIFIYQINGLYTITDDGYTISDLKLGGFDIGASAKRRSLLDLLFHHMALIDQI